MAVLFHEMCVQDYMDTVEATDLFLVEYMEQGAPPNYPVPAPYALYGGKLLPIVTVNIHGDNVFCGLAYMTADGMTLAYCR